MIAVLFRRLVGADRPRGNKGGYVCTQAADPQLDQLATWVSKRTSPFTLDDAARAIGIRQGPGLQRTQALRLGIALAELGCRRVALREPYSRQTRRAFLPPNYSDARGRE